MFYSSHRFNNASPISNGLCGSLGKDKALQLHFTYFATSNNMYHLSCQISTLVKSKCFGMMLVIVALALFIFHPYFLIERDFSLDFFSYIFRVGDELLALTQ